MLTRIALLAVIASGLYWGFQTGTLPEPVEHFFSSIHKKESKTSTASSTVATLTEGTAKEVNGIELSFDKIVDDFRCFGDNCPEAGGIAARITITDKDKKPFTTVISSDSVPTQIGERVVSIGSIEGGVRGTSTQGTTTEPYKVLFNVISLTSSTGTPTVLPAEYSIKDMLMNVASDAGISTERVKQACSLILSE